MEWKIFDSLLEPVFVLSKDGKVLYCNEPATQIAALPLRKIIKAQHIRDVLNFTDQLPSIDSLASLADPTPYKEIAFRSAAGKDGKAQVTIQPVIREGSENAYLVFFRDVTLEETLQRKYRGELEQKEGYIRELETAQKELKKYSQNLEKMVDERTAQIRNLNQMMSALLDSLNQGFFLFEKEGLCLPVASKACEQLLEINPSGKFIWDVLKIPEDKKNNIKRWIQTLFSEMLPFADLAPLGPKNFSHSGDLHIQLDYFPLRSQDNSIQAVVVVATDTTHLDLARAEANKERQSASLITNLIRRKKEITQFIADARNLFRELQIYVYPTETPDWSGIFRVIHTLKGGAASFSIQSLVDTCHEAEDVLDHLKKSDEDQLWEQFLSLVSRMEAGFKSYLKQVEPVIGFSATQGLPTVETQVSFIEGLVQKLSQIPTAQDIGCELEKLLLVPINQLFEVYDEVIQQVAAATEKKVNPIKFVGDQIPVRRECYVDLISSLIHQFRNAIDHGIESPSVRIAAGKSEFGNITVYTEVQKNDLHNSILIKVMDDGGGISPDIIRNKLGTRGVDTSSESDAEVIQHVFDSQFSTRDQVTETSGRGVGMDAILFVAKRMGGTAWIESKLGVGTTLLVRVPLVTQIQKAKAA